MRPDDLTIQLLAAIERREKAAFAASPGPWAPNAEHDEVVAVDGETVAEGFALSNNQLRATVDFIVDNNPTAVLRRCASEREIVEELICTHPMTLGWAGLRFAVQKLAESYGLTVEQDT